MIKLPKPFVDKDMVEKCVAFALEKAPNNGMVHHVAGMFAERHKYVSMFFKYSVCFTK